MRVINKAKGEAYDVKIQGEESKQEAPRVLFIPSRTVTTLGICFVSPCYCLYTPVYSRSLTSLPGTTLSEICVCFSSLFNVTN